MLVYITQDESLPPSLCPINVESALRPAGPEVSVPDTPWTHTVPLPGTPPTLTTMGSSDEMFPLNILQSISVPQQTTLCSISFTTPVHVHTPIAHIGIIYGDFPGEKINGTELIQCLQEVYREMSQLAGTRGEMLFTQHVALPLRALEYQNLPESTPKQRPGDGLVNPLLGNDEVWGLEQMSIGGYSVVHLSGQSSRLFNI